MAPGQGCENGGQHSFDPNSVTRGPWNCQSSRIMYWNGRVSVTSYVLPLSTISLRTIERQSTEDY